MADFLTRLAERTLGVAPVVQPLVAPMFASEPANHSLHLEWDSEAATSSGNPDRAQAPSAEETSPAWDAQTGRPEDTAMAQQGGSRNLSAASPARPQGMYDPRSGQHHPAEPAALERDISIAPEDRQNPPSPTSGRPRNLSHDPPNSARETPGRLEPPHLVESDPIRRDEAAPVSSQALHAEPTSTGLVAESPSVTAAPDRVGTLVEEVRGATLPSRSSPNVQTFSGAQGGILESQALLDRLALPDAPLVKTEMIRSRLNTNVERTPREIHMSAPETPTPTIRVNIGRIDVRAITPHPVRRNASARSGPALSLDAYLQQRNEGRR